MAATIWKFPIQVHDEQEVVMPEGAQLLHVAMQQGQPCVWAQVNPDAAPTPRKIRVFGTGHDMPDDPGQYLGTFPMMEGRLIFHVYDATH